MRKQANIVSHRLFQLALPVQAGRQNRPGEIFLSFLLFDRCAQTAKHIIGIKLSGIFRHAVEIQNNVPSSCFFSSGVRLMAFYHIIIIVAQQKINYWFPIRLVEPATSAVFM